MTTSYTATATLARQHSGEDFADQVHGTDLDEFGTVTTTDDQGRARIILTVDAPTIDKADIIARGLLSRFDDVIRFEIATAEEFQRASTEIPDLITLTDAADRMGITRQALLGRVSRGTLPAKQVGRQWVIATSVVNAHTA